MSIDVYGREKVHIDRRQAAWATGRPILKNLAKVMAQKKKYANYKKTIV